LRQWSEAKETYATKLAWGSIGIVKLAMMPGGFMKSQYCTLCAQTRGAHLPPLLQDNDAEAAAACAK